MKKLSRNWNAMRLALADAIIMVAVVMGCIYGFVWLILGPPEMTHEEIMDALLMAGWIVCVVWAMMFMAHYGKPDA